MQEKKSITLHNFKQLKEISVSENLNLHIVLTKKG